MFVQIYGILLASTLSSSDQKEMVLTIIPNISSMIELYIILHHYTRIYKHLQMTLNQVKSNVILGIEKLYFVTDSLYFSTTLTAISPTHHVRTVESNFTCRVIIHSHSCLSTM